LFLRGINKRRVSDMRKKRKGKTKGSGKPRVDPRRIAQILENLPLAESGKKKKGKKK